MVLSEWIVSNNLDAEVNGCVCTIGDKKFLILERGEEEVLFDDDFDILLSDEEGYILSQDENIKILFEFGKNWYYSDPSKIDLKIFKYIGEATSEFDIQLPYLGIHGEYDLCNGTRTYKDWCAKAKFFKSPSLAICENNTLAGTLSFQMACKNAGIKSILGETVTVSEDKEKLITYQVKLYVKNFEGWIKLLNISSQIKVFNDGFVLEDYLLKNSEGLICVLSGVLDKKRSSLFQQTFGDDLYYQLDFVEWASQDKEKEHLDNLSDYIKNYIDVIKPVIISDSYYLDKEEGYIKKILNSIGKVHFQNQSKDQYFKSLSDIYNQINELSPSDEWLEKPFFIGIENALELSDKCDFEIKLGELHLPKYEMTKEESENFETNEDLFFSLIDEGLERIRKNFVTTEEEYLNRVELEVEVIKSGDLIDYFLILADIVKWSRENDVLTGVGRGSAAGSLISYLLNVTQIDPIKYGLLFYRFLNPGRIGKSLPDIDTDFASDRREDVKRYMELRYGVDYVTSIGTYGTFKIKSGITDLCRDYNFDLKTTKYITSIIDDDNMSFTDFFKLASHTPVIKKFIQENPNIIESYPLLSGQVKTSSVHAAGVIIVPKEYKGKPMTIYDWMPVKKIGEALVTEWEGPVLEDSGFLKEDILATKQLQKIHRILSEIKKNRGVDVDLNEIPLDDVNVFELFKGGNNEDVFQFGAAGLQAYCRDLQPEVIDDLIATQALYRPGPMESGIHKSYIKVKNGLKEKEVDYMMEEITKDTYGFVIYQEQVMKAMVILGGFDEVEADNIRKAMGKKDMDKMAKYKPLFIQGAIDRGCDQYEALAIWNKYEAFALYAFNLSHAAAYTITGYQCQWLKYHYPLEFWSVALNFSDSDEIGRRISEMHRVSSVKVLPPDINESTGVFESNVESNEIYWSIGSIKFIGESALSSIMNDRSSKGKYYSFDDFINRVEKSKVNKRCVTNLILSGCFDKIEKIFTPAKRLGLLSKFLGDDIPEEFKDSNVNWKDYYWILKQKELTGFGYLEFDKIYKSNIEHKISNSKIRFVDGTMFQYENSVGDNKSVVGVLSDYIERKMRTKVGSFGEVTLNHNDENITVLMWSESWEKYKEEIVNSKNKIICITGKIVYDDRFKKMNVLQTTDKSKIEVL